MGFFHSIWKGYNKFQSFYHRGQACALVQWPLVFVADMIDFTARQAVAKINPTTEQALFWPRVTILGFIYIYGITYLLITQQNSYSINHSLGTVNCRQHDDYTAIYSSVSVLPAGYNGDYTVTVQSPCSHSAA